MNATTREVSPNTKTVNLTAANIQNYWRKVSKDGDLPDQANEHYRGLGKCWHWTGAMHTSGYGVQRLGAKIIKSHRATWEITRGEIPEGKCVLHRCDNRKCCNPDHLFLGTNSENSKDRHHKGRSKGPRGEKNIRHLKPERTAYGERQGSAVLTDEKVRQIRSENLAGMGQRKLAAKYGVAKSTIGRVVRRTHWRHVQ